MILPLDICLFPSLHRQTPMTRSARTRFRPLLLIPLIHSRRLSSTTLPYADERQFLTRFPLHEVWLVDTFFFRHPPSCLYVFIADHCLFPFKSTSPVSQWFRPMLVVANGMGHSHHSVCCLFYLFSIL
ncbi:hypothetical protein BJ165DRAFT_305974 [Panaeolus papilionaceus]|nr:hypothetical protein BJ165DRAFT_305974 [Panaeolus papilionaceus]